MILPLLLLSKCLSMQDRSPIFIFQVFYLSTLDWVLLRIFYVSVAGLSSMESFRVMFVHGLLDGEALWSFLWMVIEWHIVDFKRVTMVGPCIVMICMLERWVILDNNFMRHV